MGEENLGKVEHILLEDLGMHYPTSTSKEKVRYGIYKCGYCGKEFRVQISRVKNGYTKSCGCQQYLPREKSIKHNLHKNRFYTTWSKMLRRCSNSNDTSFHNYGGRGISVCGDWLDIKNFVEWAEATHPNISGVSLDRIDNDGNYEPDNCRWADRTTQNTNQRKRKDNKSGFTGVHYDKRDKVWKAYVGLEGKLVHLGSHYSLESAVEARDAYILENNLLLKTSENFRKKEI